MVIKTLPGFSIFQNPKIFNLETKEKEILILSKGRGHLLLLNSSAGSNTDDTHRAE